MEAQKPERWKTDIKRWSKLDLNTAKFYIQEAETRLNETVQTYNINSTRTYWLLVVAMSTVSTAMGYLFSGGDLYLQATAGFSLSFSLVAIIWLYKNLKSYDVYTVGEEPKILFTSKFVDVFEGEKQYLNLIFQTMETIQFKIDNNHITNNRKMRNNKIARIAIVFMPLAFVLAIIYQFLIGYRLIWFLPS